MPERVCGVHGVALRPKSTRFGIRLDCPIPGCDVMCWDGGTSSPANQVTRNARQRCHDIFDPLWRSKSKFKNRGAAYRWLKKVMGLSSDQAHIGMFDLGQCNKLIEILTNVSESSPAGG